MRFWRRVKNAHTETEAYVDQVKPAQWCCYVSRTRKRTVTPPCFTHVLSDNHVPGLDDPERDRFIQHCIPLAAEAVDAVFDRDSIDPDSDDREHLRTVILLSSRWDPRVVGESGLPALGPGLVSRLRDAAGWRDVTFNDLDEYTRWRAGFVAVTVAMPTREESLLDWYSNLRALFPRLALVALIVVTIPFSNAAVSAASIDCMCSFHDLHSLFVGRTHI